MINIETLISHTSASPLIRAQKISFLGDTGLTTKYYILNTILWKHTL